jgi:hypothetical protein
MRDRMNDPCEFYWSISSPHILFTSMVTGTLLIAITQNHQHVSLMYTSDNHDIA